MKMELYLPMRPHPCVAVHRLIAFRRKPSDRPTVDPPTSWSVPAERSIAWKFFCGGAENPRFKATARTTMIHGKLFCHLLPIRDSE
jgi:hypothetical protein